MNQYTLLLLFIILTTLSCSLSKHNNLQVDGNLFPTSIVANQHTYYVGDDITLDYIIQNKSKDTVYVSSETGALYKDGVQIRGFSLKITDENGQILEKTFAGDMIIGNGDVLGTSKLIPNQEKIIDIPNIKGYDVTKKAGKYKITTTRDQHVYIKPKYKKINKLKRDRRIRLIRRRMPVFRPEDLHEYHYTFTKRDSIYITVQAND